jgi:malonyl-CoA decarboxylase
MATKWLDRMLSSVADRGLPWVKLPAGSGSPLQRARDLARALIGERGEASGVALARELVAAYEALGPEDRLELLRILATDFAPDEAKLKAAMAAYAEEPSPDRLLALTDAVEPPRQELLRRMNMAPGGTAALVRMRETLFPALKKEPALKVVDADLRHLLGSWFNRGFLELRRIDWHTPAAILEKLIAYEAVHAIEGWDDLRRRLAPDRRCFGFFHPALRDEPLIFVEIALTKGLAGAIQPLLEPLDPATGAAAAEEAARTADTAIFYSISNCQPGLRGISFGNFLIKQVVTELQQEMRSPKVFSTLSPIPGFRAWLDRRIAAGAPGLLTADERKALAQAADGEAAETGRGTKGAFKALLSRPDWPADPRAVKALKGPLTRLGAEYLVAPGSKKGPSDPVARFHLGNGARVERINFLGDTSAKGMRDSYGLMVNYRYELADIEANHEAFVKTGAVARAGAVDKLLAASPKPRPAGPATPAAVPEPATPRRS